MAAKQSMSSKDLIQSYIEKLQKEYDELLPIASQLQQNSATAALFVDASIEEARRLLERTGEITRELSRYYRELKFDPNFSGGASTVKDTLPAGQTLNTARASREIEEHLHAMRRTFLQFHAQAEQLLANAQNPVVPRAPLPSWIRSAVLAAGLLFIAFLAATYGYPAWHDFRVQRAHDQGIAAYVAQDWVKAVEKFNYVYEEDPERDGISVNLADSYDNLILSELNANDWDSARKHAREFIKLEIDPVRAENLLYDSYTLPAQTLFDQGDWQDVRTLLDELTTANITLDTNAEALYQRSLFEEAGVASQLTPPDWDSVQTLLWELIDRPSEITPMLIPNLYDLLADSHLAQAEILLDDSANPERWHLIQSELAPFIALRPVGINAKLTQAQALYCDSHYIPGKSYLDTEQFEEARSELVALHDFERTYQLEPYKDSNELLANAFYVPAERAIEAEAWDEAFLLLDSLYGIDGEYEQTRDYLSTAAYHLGMEAVDTANVTDARRYFERMNEVNPGYTEALLEQKEWRGVRIILDTIETPTSPLTTPQEEIYQRSYYLEARAASEQTPANWETAETLLLALLARPTAPIPMLNPGAYNLLAESYLVRAEVLMADESNPDRWVQARALLEQGTEHIPEELSDYSEITMLIGDTFYRPGASAVESGDWETALNYLDPLYRRDPSFRDATSLLSHTLYELGRTAHAAGDLNVAQQDLEQLLEINPYYADAATLLADVYYVQAETILNDTSNSERWQEARTKLTQLIGLNPNYRDAETLLRETYYSPAKDTLEAGESTQNSRLCDTSRTMLLEMFELDETFDLEADLQQSSKRILYKDSRTLLHETYYCEVQIALAQQDLEGGLDPLRELNTLSPYYKDAATLYTQTLYDLGSAAFDAAEWETSRAYFHELLAQEPYYKDAPIKLREAYYQPGALAFEAERWDEVRENLNPLLFGTETLGPIDPAYKDARTLFLESLYRPANTSLERQEWDTARNDLNALLQAVALLDGIPVNEANYPQSPQADQDAQTLLYESFYRPGQLALEAGNWQTARDSLTSLLDLVAGRENIDLKDARYKNTYGLLREAYYQPALAAIDQDDWQTARQELNDLLALITTYEERDLGTAQYRRAQILLRQTYYIPGTAALESGMWGTARTEFWGLLTLLSERKGVALNEVDYRDTQTLLREAYYRPALAAFADEDWDQARRELNSLFDTIHQIEAIESQAANYRDAQDIFRRSYYVPGQRALENQNWAVARENLEALVTLDPNFLDAAALYVDAYLQPGKIALDDEDWGLARQDLTKALELDPGNEAIRSLVFDAYFLPGKAAFEAEDWETARWHLGVLVDANLATEQAVEMIKATYIKPVEKLIESSDEQAARAALEIFRQAYPDDVNTYHSLLLATYNKPLESAITNEDWNSAADQYVQLMEANPMDDSLDQIVLEEPSLRHALATYFAPYWTNGGLNDIPTTLSGHSGSINQIAASAGMMLVSGSSDGTLRIWDLTTLNSITILTGNDWIDQVTTDPRGYWLATTGNQPGVMIWLAQTGQYVTTLEADKWISAVAFNAGGTLLASVSEDGVVTLWAAENGFVSENKFDFDARITTAEFSTDGSQLAIGLADKSIVLIDMDTNEATEVTHLDYLAEGIAFSPDGETFVTIGNSASFDLWSLDGTLIRSFSGHTDWIRGAAFNGNGSLLITISAGHELNVWNIEYGQQVQSLPITGGPVNVCFSLDNRTLSVGMSTGEILLWTAPAELEAYEGK
jgi:outer membrane protein assembly factor BamD (BamD/ComL family)